MLVYGIRCAPADLTNLPSDAIADYYMDYGLLVFPEYTRPLAVASHGYLNARFWERAKLAVEQPTRCRVVDNLEHPWITDEENDVLVALRQYYPNIQTEWYNVPQVAVHEPSSE